MSRIYMKPFTFKSAFHLVFLGLSVFFFDNHAIASNEMKITGHYYVAQNASLDKYVDKIQWEVTSIPEWTKFLTNLKTMPKDLEKNNPMGLKQPEVIHFNVNNNDNVSGHDIFISKAGIQQFSRMPLDRYYDNNPDFKAFLETELSMNPGYDAASGDADIHQPGIVVIYRGSSQLKNPFWIVKLSDKNVMERYKFFINGFKKSLNNSLVKEVVSDVEFDTEGTFILYLNYPDAPHNYIVVGTTGGIRGTQIEQQYYYYQDAMGYFSMFKRQAEDNLRAIQKVDDAPEEKRKRAAEKGGLF